MGVDYRDKNPYLSDMHTSLQFMRIIPAVSYQVMPGLSIGGAIDLAWGSLDIGATMCMDTDNNVNNGLERCWNASGGQSQSYGLGAQIGIAYNMGDMLYAGLNYQSSVKMKYKKVFDSNGDGTYEDLKLEQPQEVAFGLGVKPLDNLKVGLDIRWVNWSDAEGYKQFKWKDQWVFAVGGEYTIDKLALRLGYNYGKSPIRDENNLDMGQMFGGTSANNIPDFAAPFGDYNVAWFNLVGFPAITEQHITLGAGYQFTKNFSLAVSYVHALEKEVKSSSQGNMATVGAKNAQDSIGVGLEWTF